MTETTIPKNLFSKIFPTIKQAIKGDESFDFTSGSIKKAVILLAVPMVLEMLLESIFALVDLYFVGHLQHSSYAIQTVGLTESVITIVYSIAMGISMSATAIVARRIGEKNPVAAAKAAMQAIIIAIVITSTISVLGFIYAKDILLTMGASLEAVQYGYKFTQITMGGSLCIILLFLINGIFRGAGNAAIAMKSLWIANICNIILCPVLINGFGPIPALGLVGASIATTSGRSIGVMYQLYHLFNGRGILKITLACIIPDFVQIKALIKIAAPAVLQFVITSCSWIFLAQLVAITGGDQASAGYQIALRIVMFFILPAWGLSNATTTLVGQNLGARQIERAEKSVLTTAKYNAVFMATITVITFFLARYIVSFFTKDMIIQNIAVQALQILSYGYVLYGIGMVLINTFNGSGDTWTPTLVNFFGFWLFQIPLAYVLAKYYNLGPTGVFIAIPVVTTLITLASIVLYEKGKWKRMRV